MTRFLRLNARLYDGILRFYPAELRRDFGPAIRAVFAEDLDDAWRRSGFRGALSVWWCALCELFRIVLPGLKANPQIVVPFVALGFNVLVVGIEVLLHRFYVAAPQGPNSEPLAWTAGEIVFGTSLLATLIAAAVVRAGKVRVVALGLKSCGLKS